MTETLRREQPQPQERSKPIRRRVKDVAEFVEVMNSYVSPEPLWRETDSVQASDSSNKQEPETL